MSTTAAGMMFIISLGVALALAYRPFGDYMYRALHPGPPRFERVVYKLVAGLSLSGWRDLNPRPLRPERGQAAGGARPERRRPRSQRVGLRSMVSVADGAEISCFFSAASMMSGSWRSANRLGVRRVKGVRTETTRREFAWITAPSVGSPPPLRRRSA